MPEIVKRKGIEASVLLVSDSAAGAKPPGARDRKALPLVWEVSVVHFWY